MILTEFSCVKCQMIVYAWQMSFLHCALVLIFVPDKFLKDVAACFLTLKFIPSFDTAIYYKQAR